MSSSYIQFEVGEDGIALAVLNRPDKLNALNSAVVGELEGIVSRLESDPGVRALILTGAGQKAFAAGADIGELAALAPLEARAYAARGQAVLCRLENCGRISIAAINGYALGGGLELAMACTLRFASPNARLGLPEVGLGLIPGYGGTQRLPRLVGRARAMELLLSGDPVDAAEACRIGLVNQVVPQDELIPFCRRWLSGALAKAPRAVELALQAAGLGLQAGLEEGLRFEAAAFGLLAATRDRAEGLQAFLEKRKASFTGT